MQCCIVNLVVNSVKELILCCGLYIIYQLRSRVISRQESPDRRYCGHICLEF